MIIFKKDLHLHYSIISNKKHYPELETHVYASDVSPNSSGLVCNIFYWCTGSK